MCCPHPRTEKRKVSEWIEIIFMLVLLMLAVLPLASLPIFIRQDILNLISNLP